MKNVNTFVVTVVAMLTAVSFAASPLTDADKFYAGKKWIDAAKAYEAFASGKSGGRDCWRARLRAALAREKAGDRKNALSGADRVIRGAAGRAQDDLVGEAFLLKQRLLFHAKIKTGPRDSLLKGAVARLGWNVHVSRLYENEAVRRIREGDADAAWRLCSNSRIVLSPVGSNIVAVLSFARTKGTGGVKSDEAIKILSALHASDRQTATALIDLARTSTTGAARIDLTCAAAELSAATGDGKRACRLYEELLSGALSHAQRQRLRLRYAGYLKSSGQDERGAEIYADWAKDIKPGEPYSAGMKQYVGFLMERHRYRAAKDVFDKFCGERSGVYASTERKAVLQKIDVGIASGDEDSEVQAGWKMLSDADGLAKSKRHGDAMKLYRAIATRYAGDLRTEALFHLGNCLCGIAKYSQAAETWDSLGSQGGKDLKVRCLKRKADMLLVEKRDASAAREAYNEALEILKAGHDKYGLRDIIVSMAVCDAVDGDIDKAEPVFRSEYERALKRMDVNIVKWHALVAACAAAREYAEFKGDGFRDAIIADLLAASGRYAEAIRLFRQCLQQRDVPKELQAFVAMQLAESLDRNNQHAEALKTYQLMRVRYRDCRCAPLAMLRAGVLCVGPLNDNDGGRQFFKFIEDTWPNDPIAERALFYRLTLAIWTKQWEEATTLRNEFFKRHPKSEKMKIVEVEYGELIARRITVLEENIVR